MLWVYILECENGVFYVGQTKRLFRRFWEHENGNGGINTSTNTPRKIVAIYKVATLCKFIEYDNIIINRNDNIYFNRCSRLLNEFNTVNEEENNYDEYEAENVEPSEEKADESGDEEVTEEKASEGEEVTEEAASEETDYSKMSVAELKVLLKEKKLAVSGKKADLIDRLQGDSK